jgi:hypothetical protein
MDENDQNKTIAQAQHLDVPVALLDYLTSPAHKARTNFVVHISRLPDLGLWKLSLPEAADLIVVDMYGSGKIDKEIPGREDEVLRRDDAVVLDALAAERKMILDRLIESVSDGSLKTAQTRRNILTGTVDPESTILDFDVLHEWLEGFGYNPGDWIDEYAHHEADILDDLAEALFDIRNIRSNPSGVVADKLAARHQVLSDVELDAIPEYAEKAAQKLREIAKGYAEEAAYLRRELEQRPARTEDSVLRTKGRNTLYRLVVALCVAARVNPTERGAAATIAKFTENVGLPVTDDTIRKILVQLPEIGSD